MANEFSEYRKSNTPAIPPAQGIYEYSTVKKAPLGTRLMFADGRVFRYSANSTDAALVAGKFVQPVIINFSAWLNKTVTGESAAGDYTGTLGTSSACTTCTDGWLQINDADGEGIQYKIKSAVANATTSTSTDLTLYDPVATALTDATSEGTIIFNPYQLTKVCSAATDIVLGVPPIAVPISTSALTYYYWLQTWGIANVFSEGVPAAGASVFLGVGTTAAGTTTVPYLGSGTTSQAVGIQLLVGVSGEYKPVYLMIAP